MYGVVCLKFARKFALIDRAAHCSNIYEFALFERLAFAWMLSAYPPRYRSVLPVVRIEKVALCVYLDVPFRSGHIAVQ